MENMSASKLKKIAGDSELLKFPPGLSSCSFGLNAYLSGKKGASISFILMAVSVLSPQITNQLEQRCYKDLRNENFGSLKVVLRIYGKLLSSCKEQM